MSRRWKESELRELIGLIGGPMVIARSGIVLAALLLATGGWIVSGSRSILGS